MQNISLFFKLLTIVILWYNHQSALIVQDKIPPRPIISKQWNMNDMRELRIIELTIENTEELFN
jgi:hypothetical protein